MMIRIALSAFAFVFLAELGDKTQLAVLALTMKSPSPWPVLIGASLALVLSTGLAVGLGFLANKFLPPESLRYIHYAAGGLLILVGGWTIWQA
jgi:Ca2+/H+ antiporter, TMEM165/GDT1 family